MWFFQLCIKKKTSTSTSSTPNANIKYPCMYHNRASVHTRWRNENANELRRSVICFSFYRPVGRYREQQIDVRVKFRLSLGTTERSLRTSVRKMGPAAAAANVIYVDVNRNWLCLCASISSLTIPPLCSIAYFLHDLTHTLPRQELLFTASSDGE